MHIPCNILNDFGEGWTMGKISVGNILIKLRIRTYIFANIFNKFLIIYKSLWNHILYIFPLNLHSFFLATAQQQICDRQVNVISFVTCGC
jgi:hypothetical protein